MTCINSLNGKSGIVSDEIPYLAKNIQERINTITAGISNLQQLDIALIDKRNSIINDLKDKMRQLLERTVEEILVNKTISRFSKNISFKRSDLANLIIVEKEDIDFLERVTWWNKDQAWLKEHAHYFHDLDLLREHILQELE